MKLLVITLMVAGALAKPDVSHLVNSASSDSQAAILKQDLDISPEGKYLYAYETNNGINAHEHGEQTQDGNYVGGAAAYTSPEGEKVELHYTADANGYHPEGSHLPTSPPIPEAILRSLEWIRSHPPPPAQQIIQEGRRF